MAKNINALTLSELKDKSRKDVNELLKVSFEYLLAGVAEAHSAIKDFQSIDQFNKYNKLERPLLLTYPFFISLSNGNSNSLFNLFGDFLSFTYGPASEPLQNLIPLDKSTFGNTPTALKYISIEKYSIKINDGVTEFDELKENIRSVCLNEYPEQKIRFDQVPINSDKPGTICLLHEAIDKGINILRKNSDDIFFDGKSKRITDLAKYFDAWRDKYNNSSTGKISYEDIKPAHRERVYGRTAVLA